MEVEAEVDHDNLERFRKTHDYHHVSTISGIEFQSL